MLSLNENYQCWSVSLTDLYTQRLVTYATENQLITTTQLASQAGSFWCVMAYILGYIKGYIQFTNDGTPHCLLMCCLTVCDPEIN